MLCSMVEDHVKIILQGLRALFDEILEDDGNVFVGH